MKLYRLQVIDGPVEVCDLYGTVAVFCQNKVYTDEQLSVLGNDQGIGRELVGELPALPLPAKWSEVAPFCETWIRFACSPLAGDLGDTASIWRPLLKELRGAVASMPDASAPPENRPVRYSDPTAVANELKRYRDWSKGQLSKRDEDNPPDEWADYRHGPGGPFLTPAYCKELGVTGTDLSKDIEAKKNRRKNPAGRKGGDYVYRHADVSRIANRKPDPKPPSSEKLSQMRKKLRSERK